MNANIKDVENRVILDIEEFEEINEKRNDNSLLVVENKKEQNIILKKIYAGTKFIFDRFVSTIFLILLLPLFFVIAILIKIDDRGPVFFKQRRTGKYGKPFTLYKFRTMVVNNDVHDFSKSDKYTKIGKFLRKTSLDELGQLINIVKGDMSFIGPRPWIEDYYENMNEQQRHRCDVRPGLTGLAQCNGRNNLTIFEKINYDLEYIENYSFRQELQIIFKTIYIVLKKTSCDLGKQGIQTELEALRNQNTEIKNIVTKDKEQVNNTISA